MITNINPHHLFIVQKNADLLVRNDEVLYNLYQPFLGSKAIGLYQTLQYVDFGNAPKSLHQLLQYAAVELEDISTLLNKLSATNLLHIGTEKIDEFDTFYFSIKPALSYQEFFQDPMLVRILQNYIGFEAVQAMQKKCEYQQAKTQKINSLPNVNAKCKDVFKDELIERRVETTVSKAEKVMSNSTYSFDAFYMLLPNLVKEQYQFDGASKKLLSRLAEIHELTSEEMVLVFNRSMQMNNGVITEKELRQQAYEITLNELRRDNEKQAQAETSDASEITIKNDVVRKALYQMTKKTPAEYVQIVTGSKTPKDLQIIEKLAMDYQLADEVINVLINYVYNDTNNLSAPFMEAIAQSWCKLGVKTAEQAYLTLKNFNKDAQQRQQKNNTKTGRVNYRRTEQVADFVEPETTTIDTEAVKQAWAELGGE